MQKKIIWDWHLFGLLPIVFAIISYAISTEKGIALNEYFWVCPMAAILSGLAVLSHNRFAISAVIVWIILGPMMTLIFEPKMSLGFWHIHHIFSILILLLILSHIKESWHSKGFLFGTTSFYGYMMITSMLNGGAINLVGEWFHMDESILYLGILFSLLSIVILFSTFLKRRSGIATKGFTLIELLVAVAIICVVASIILANVMGFLNKGKNAGIKANMNNLYSYSASYYLDTSLGDYTYDNFCTSAKVMEFKNQINSLSPSTVTCSSYCANGSTCDSGSVAFCATAQQRGSFASWSQANFCVDSAGNKKEGAICLGSSCRVP